MKVLRIAALSVAALTMVACMLEVEEGSGQYASQERELAEFQDLEIEGSLDVTVVGGESRRVHISGDDNLVEALITDVDDGVLTVRTPNHTAFQPRLPLRIHVETPELRDVTLAGSGDIRLREIRGERLTLEIAGSGDVTVDGRWRELRAEIAGSGDIELTGQAKRLRARVAGSGDIDARALQTLRARAEITGSGDIRVCSEQKLTVEIAGSGDVHTYCGPESVSRRISGSGHIYD